MRFKTTLSLISATLLLTTFTGCNDITEMFSDKAENEIVVKAENSIGKPKIEVKKISKQEEKLQKIIRKEKELNKEKKAVEAYLEKHAEDKDYSNPPEKTLFQIIQEIAQLNKEKASLRSKIDKAMGKSLFEIDIQKLILGINKYYEVYEDIPETGSLHYDSTSWSKGFGISSDITKKWTLTKYPNNIIIIPKSGTYSDTQDNIKLEIFKKKCEIGSVEAKGCSLLVDKVEEKEYNYMSNSEEDETDSNITVEITTNIAVIDTKKDFLIDLNQIIAGVNMYYDIYEKIPKTGSFNDGSIIWPPNFIPEHILKKWTITKNKDNVVVIPKKDAYPKSFFPTSQYEEQCEIGSSKKACFLLVDKIDTAEEAEVISEQKIIEVEVKKEPTITISKEFINSTAKEKEFLEGTISLIKSIKLYTETYDRLPETGSLNKSTSSINKTDLLDKEVSKKWWLGKFSANSIELELKDDYYADISKKYKIRVFNFYCDIKNNRRSVCILKK
jgi:hypothetical protein